MQKLSTVPSYGKHSKMPAQLRLLYLILWYLAQCLPHSQGYSKWFHRSKGMVLKCPEPGDPGGAEGSLDIFHSCCCSVLPDSISILCPQRRDGASCLEMVAEGWEVTQQHRAWDCCQIVSSTDCSVRGEGREGKFDNPTEARSRFIVRQNDYTSHLCGGADSRSPWEDSLGRNGCAEGVCGTGKAGFMGSCLPSYDAVTVLRCSIIY